MLKFKVLIFLLLIQLAACHKFFTIVPAQISGQAVTTTEADQVKANLQKKAQELSSLKALARVEVAYRDRNSSLRYALLAQRPDLLRVEGLPLNGSFSLSVLTAFQEKLQFVDYTEKTVAIGELTRKTLEELIQIPAEPTELIDYLAGVFPINNHKISDLRIFFDSAADVYQIIDIQKGDYWQLQASDFNLTAAQFKKSKSSEPFLQIQYEYNAEGTPEKVVFVMPDKNLKITLSYQIFETNSALSNRAFNVSVPTNYSKKRL